MTSKLRKATFYLLLLAGICASGYAVAKWVGQYYCGSTCNFNQPLPDGYGYGYIFIFTDVNLDVSSWVASQGNPNTVKLCNGSECTLYRYVKLSGQWQLVSKYFSTWVGTTMYPDGGAGGASVAGDKLVERWGLGCYRLQTINGSRCWQEAHRRLGL